MESLTYKKHIWIAGTVALVCISFASLAFGIQNLDSIKHPNGQVATISVSGEGEVTAVPDIATVSFTVRESAKTVPEAQKLVEAKIAKGLKELEVIGVEKKDVKTLSYNVSPKYETQGGYCAPGAYACPPMKTVINGYEVSQSVSVKVRKVDQAGEVLGMLGKAEITEISGPDFTVDDMDNLKANAKVIAIKKAQAKAEEEAKALGVSLGSIISFSEDNGGYYPPMMYASKAIGGVAMAESARDQVSLPEGENLIKSRVTITYIIK
jgi:uncharacterized protein YggE